MKFFSQIDRILIVSLHDILLALQKFHFPQLQKNFVFFQLAQAKALITLFSLQQTCLFNQLMSDQQRRYHFRLHSIGAEFEPRQVHVANKNCDWYHGDDNGPTIRDGAQSARRPTNDVQGIKEEGSTQTRVGHDRNPEIHYGVFQVYLSGPIGYNHNETPRLLDQLGCHQARTCKRKKERKLLKNI